MDKKVSERKVPSVWSPYVDQVLDDEERQIENDLEKGLYVEAEDQEARMKEWREAVEISRKKKSVTVRIYQRTLDELKVRALQDGLPYQTLMTSILHKYVTGRLVERD
jgi:predicted DNA binding CopG/RHH family protein